MERMRKKGNHRKFVFNAGIRFKVGEICFVAALIPSLVVDFHR